LRKQFENDLALLRNELSLEKQINPDVEMNFLDKLTPEQFNNKEIFEYAKTYVDKLQKHYIRQYNKASDERDNLISKYNKTPKDKEKFIALKNNYENDNLSDLVKNKNEFNKIIEKNNELIQRADPVFLDPVKSNGLRSHFFAPRKKLFGKYVDTYWVNILVIWCMSLILVITLYFDLLKKLLDSIEKLLTRFNQKTI
jgi:hypothetical protein